MSDERRPGEMFYPNLEGGDCQQQLAAANERIAALEGALIAFIARTKYDTPGWANRADDGYYSCSYCCEWGDRRDDYESVKHAPDCALTVARELLDKS